jgi:transcriptional regulator with XRE-family HTH domain
MAFRDPAWSVFLEELRAHLEGHMTSAALAGRLGVDEEAVRNWRKGRTHPRLGQLRMIAEILHMGGDPATGDADPLFLYRRMGLLPPKPEDADLIDTAYRLQELEQSLSEAIDRVGSLGRREGANAIVGAAVRTGEWAVAVWPVTEGPADCQLRVADRIDIRRTDERPVTTDDVWQDRALKAALRASHAVPASRTPRWSADPGTSHWSISHVGSPRSPLVPLPHPGVTSVVCFALTVDSWVNDVASLIGTALGYGLTTTRDLTMETYGLRFGRTTGRHRQAVYEVLLERPPEARVLSHFARLSSPPRSPFLPPSGRWQENVIFVWLRESDELLQQWLRRGYAQATIDDLVRDRQGIDEYAADVPNPAQVITLDISQQADTSQRWQQVLECVSGALTQMVDRGFLTADLTSVHGKAELDDPSIAVPLLRWLRKDGCAAVLAAE